MFIRSSVTGAASPGGSGALNAKTARKMRSWRVDLPSVCQPLCRSGLEAEEPALPAPFLTQFSVTANPNPANGGALRTWTTPVVPTGDRGTRVYRAHRLQ